MIKGVFQLQEMPNPSLSYQPGPNTPVPSHHVLPLTSLSPVTVRTELTALSRTQFKLWTQKWNIVKVLTTIPQGFYAILKRLVCCGECLLSATR